MSEDRTDGFGLDPGRIAGLLCTRRYGRSLRVLEITASTNDDARSDAGAGAPDGHVVLADSQRGGRGSHGRSWSSPARSDLYLSIVARPALSLAELPSLTLAVGLGVAEAVEALLGPESSARTEVKWPNDVLLLGKKCAGVLIEASSDGVTLGPLVIGIGLNVNRSEWPEELLPLATSVRAARQGAHPIDRELACARLLECVEQRVDRHVADGSAASAAALDARLALRGRRVRCGAVEGTLLGVSSQGAIRIASDAGVTELISGRLHAI